jgi:hypothetical protein
VRKTLRLLLAISATLIAAVALAACGGSGGTGSSLVAQVGSVKIDDATLSHWMSSIVGGDYYESLGHRAPQGLVADPAYYTGCISAIEAIGPAKTPANATQTHQELLSKCQELHQSVKEQALSYLVNASWLAEEDAEMGINITSQEVQQRLERLKAEQFPNEQAFLTYVSNHNWAVSDEAFLVKRNLLAEKLQTKLERSLRRTVTGGPQSLQRAILKRELESTSRWKPKTVCSTGYLIAECRNYKAPKTTPTAPDILLEQIAASR